MICVKQKSVGTSSFNCLYQQHMILILGMGDILPNLAALLRLIKCNFKIIYSGKWTIVYL